MIFVILAAMEQHFYGHGKLMLTGEYFVLDGAKTLALPTKFGQHFDVRKLSGSNSNLFWVALKSKKQAWLQLTFDTTDFSCTTHSPQAETLQKLLRECRNMNPEFLMNEDDLAVQTALEFPNDWGLGSSSTLIYCLSQFAKVDGYELLQRTMGGSGYDVACAGSDAPIIYELKEGKPKWEQIHFTPSFRHQLFFVHLGQKQLSSSGIQHYRSRKINKSQYVQWLNVLTESLVSCASITKCKQIIEEHESYVSEALGISTVKQTLFQDVDVAAKSLGAWGGDFVMLAFEGTKDELMKLLQPKGFTTVLSWEEMIL